MPALGTDSNCIGGQQTPADFAALAAQMIRAALEAHTGVKAPALPPEMPAAAYGAAPLELCSTLLAAADQLGPPGGIAVPVPEPMENFMQG